LEAEIATSGLDPVQYMLRIMRDESQPDARRDWAAATVAPYVNPRLAVVDSTIRKEVEVSPLNDEQRRARARAMILEAFAERPTIPDLRVVAGREVPPGVGDGMDSGKVIDVITLEKKG